MEELAGLCRDISQWWRQNRSEIVGAVGALLRLLCMAAGAMVLSQRLIEDQDLAVMVMLALWVWMGVRGWNLAMRIHAADDATRELKEEKERVEHERGELEGARELAQETRTRAEAEIAEAQGNARQARADAAGARRNARAEVETQRQVADHLLDDSQMMAIWTASSLPLEGKLRSAIFVGRRVEDSEECSRERKEDTVRERLRLWKERSNRYGASLLELVEEQGGLCGNPEKGEDWHGCGCWLYALPPGSIHIDHIKPQSEGGTDDRSNLQALCHSCNLRKGARTQQQARLPY